MQGGAPRGASRRPTGQRLPAVAAGFKCRYGSQIEWRRVVLEEMVQEGPQHMQPKIRRRIAAEFNGAQAAAVQALLMMEPGTHDEVERRMIGVPRFERLVNGNVAVDILLVPQAMDQHHRNRDALLGENPVQSLRLPEFIIGGM